MLHPIWCSVSKNNCLQAIENTVVYALSVPIDEVIYFDGGKWDYVLNDLYIPSSTEDAAAYRHTIEKLSVSDEFSFLTGKYKGLFPEIEKKIRASWERIFTIENWNDLSVQANLWIIRSEYVQHIIEPGEDFYMITADMEETFPLPSSSVQCE